MHFLDVSHDVSRTLDQGVNEEPDHTLWQTGSCEGRNSFARGSIKRATRPSDCGKHCVSLSEMTNFRGIRLTILWTEKRAAQKRRKNLWSCSHILYGSQPPKSLDFEGPQGTYQQLGKTFYPPFRVRKLRKNPWSGYIHEMCNHHLHPVPHMMKGGECGGNTHADQRRPVDTVHFPQHRLSPPRRRRTRTRLSGLSDPYRRRLRAGLHPTPPRTTSTSRLGR